jgi:hypothetical protein
MGALEALGAQPCLLVAADVLAQDPAQKAGARLPAAMLIEPEDQIRGQAYCKRTQGLRLPGAARYPDCLGLARKRRFHFSGSAAARAGSSVLLSP